MGSGPRLSSPLISTPPGFSAPGKVLAPAFYEKDAVTGLPTGRAFDEQGNNLNIVTATIDAVTGVVSFVAQNGSPIALSPGYRAVLFGDSMTANYNESQTSTTATYDSGTGVLTYPLTSHGLLSGMIVTIYSLNQPGLAGSYTGPVTVVDANTVTMQLSKGLNISASISGTVFMTYPQWKSSKGWFSWMNTLAGNRFNVVKNAAQDGDITSNMLKRLQDTCLSYNPQVVFMQIGGINDLGSGLSDEYIWENQQKILAAITAQAICVCLTITPVVTPHALATTQHMARVLRLRRRLMEYAKSNTRLILVDSYGAIVNPTNTTGLALGTGVLLSDGIHYSPTGAYKVGALVWAKISSLFPAPESSAIISAADNYPSSALTLTSLSRTNSVITAVLASHGFVAGEKIKITGGSSEVLNDLVTVATATSGSFTWNSPGSDGAITGTVIAGRSANLLQTPLLLVATGGTVSGANNSGVAAANVKTTQSGTWGTGGTIVSSVVPNPNGFGNNQQIVVTPGTGSVTNPTGIIQVAASNTLLPYMKAGRSYKFGAEVSVANVSGSTLTELKIRLILTIGASFPEITAMKAVDGVAVYMPDGSYDLETPSYVLPAGSLTAVQWELDAKFNAVSAQAVTISIGRLRVIEVEQI